MKVSRYAESDFLYPANLLVFPVVCLSAAVVMFVIPEHFNLSKLHRGPPLLALMTFIGFISAAILNVIQHFQKNVLSILMRGLFIQVIAVAFYVTLMLVIRILVDMPEKPHPSVDIHAFELVLVVLFIYLLAFVGSLPGLLIGLISYKVSYRLLGMKNLKTVQIHD